jgi:hypothetical protein
VVSGGPGRSPWGLGVPRVTRPPTRTTPGISSYRGPKPTFQGVLWTSRPDQEILLASISGNPERTGVSHALWLLK